MIKTFEKYINDNSHITEDEDRILKFKIGDIVRTKIGHKDIFIIVAIDIDSSFEININGRSVMQTEYYLHHYPSDQPRSWCAERLLELVPDYELSALKYNL